MGKRRGKWQSLIKPSLLVSTHSHSSRALSALSPEVLAFEVPTGLRYTLTLQ